MNLTKQLTTKGLERMKATRKWGAGRQDANRAQAAAGHDPIQRAVSNLKEGMLYEYAQLAGEHTRLLRLALNEAEALAWQTDFPHLLFPVLAAEKANTAIAWHERQSALRRDTIERAFAE